MAAYTLVDLEGPDTNSRFRTCSAKDGSTGLRDFRSLDELPTRCVGNRCASDAFGRLFWYFTCDNCDVVCICLPPRAPAKSGVWSIREVNVNSVEPSKPTILTPGDRAQSSGATRKEVMRIALVA